jgi:hypothetical protein
LRRLSLPIILPGVRDKCRFLAHDEYLSTWCLRFRLYVNVVVFVVGNGV